MMIMNSFYQRSEMVYIYVIPMVSVYLIAILHVGKSIYPGAVGLRVDPPQSFFIPHISMSCNLNSVALKAVMKEYS